jgi:hypothetical protein
MTVAQVIRCTAKPERADENGLPGQARTRTLMTPVAA